MKVLLPIISVVCCSASLPALAADCHIDRFNFVWGQDAQTLMTVKSGKTCSIKITTHGGGMSSSSVVQQAANGTVASPASYHWDYKPRSGYSGKDAFIVQMTGESMGRHVSSGTTKLSVDVDVVP